MKHETWNLRHEIGNLTLETWNMKYETRLILDSQLARDRWQVMDSRSQTRDDRQETRDDRQQTIDNREKRKTAGRKREAEDRMENTKCGMRNADRRMWNGEWQAKPQGTTARASDIKHQQLTIRCWVLDMNHYGSNIKHEISNIKRRTQGIEYWGFYTSHLRFEFECISCEGRNRTCLNRKVRWQFRTIEYERWQVKCYLSQVKGQILNVPY
jgi:hypothetical protein